MRSLYSLLTLAVAALLVASPSASAQGWGTIKGQVVVDPAVAVPAAKVLVVNKDQVPCLAKGPIHSEEWVVEPKSRGVRWAMVWIAIDNNGAADHKAEPPIHPMLQNIPANKKTVEMDQPCCKFEPHVVGLRKGQDYLGKNSSQIPHNMSLTSARGPNVNQILPPGGTMPVPAAQWTPHYLPVTVQCNIHPWMMGRIFIFNHPYFVVTDEEGRFELKNVPAGKLRLIVWHEGAGWGLLEAGKKGSEGKAITVEADKTLDVGKIGLKP